MITINDPKQALLFDPWKYLSPKRRRLLDENWPGLFRYHLLDTLPVDKLAPFFSKDFGRPGKELYTVLGVLLLQQAMDLSDEDAVLQLSFNIAWHYALNITEESDSAKYICPKTLWTMRQVMIENDLDQTVMIRITEKLAEIFNVKTDKQRLDSVHIRSNMRRLGRISIFTRTLRKFLVNLKRHYPDLFAAVPEALRQRYMSQKGLHAFALLKPSEAAKTLEGVGRDLFDLVHLFKPQPSVCGMHSYKLMARVLNEQCEVADPSGDVRVTVKPPGAVGADSLQNPSDPEAAYDSHKGQGYQVQVMETYTESPDRPEKAQTLNLITHVSVEKACQADSNAVMPAIADAKSRNLGPKTLLADTAYGSDRNTGDAKSADVELIAPSQNGNKNKPGIDLSHFQFDDKGRITCCPQGHAPDKVDSKIKKERYSACFNLSTCNQCPALADCPVKPGKKHFYLRYNRKEYRLALRRAYEQTETFIDKYRWRAGIEATMSEYNKVTGVKRLRVRGFKSVRYCAVLKAAAVNIFRAVWVIRARRRAIGLYFWTFTVRFCQYKRFKKRCAALKQKCSGYLGQFLKRTIPAFLCAA